MKSESESVFLVCITIIFILSGGEPDLIDALTHCLMN